MATDINSSSQSPEHSVTALTVSKIMRDRHSTRAFLPTPVPRSLIEECFALAQHSPSNSNCQPWRAYVLEDAALNRLSNSMQQAFDNKLPQAVEPIPEHFKHYRSTMGHQLYGKEGYNISREDKDGMHKAQRRNYSFFDAPMGLIIYMDSALAPVDILTVGIWIQSYCMLLAERGLESCIEVSMAVYPAVVREQLGIGEDMNILCGLAIGYEDKNHHVNKLRTERDDWRRGVDFLSD